MAEPVPALPVSPAAEIVAIAIRKIVQRLDAKKQQDVLEDCKSFLASIHQIIPAHPEQQPGTLSLSSSAAASLPTSPQARDGQQQEEEQQQQQQQEGQQTQRENVAEAAPLQDQEAAPPATPVKAGNTQDGGVPETPTQAPEEQGAEGTPLKPWSAQMPQAGQPAIPLAYSLAPRTATALPDTVCSKVLAILQRAADTGKAAVIEIVLDCLQKLVAFSFLQGAVYAVDVGDSKDTLDAGVLLSGSSFMHMPTLVHAPSPLATQAAPASIASLAKHDHVHAALIQNWSLPKTASSCT